MARIRSLKIGFYQNEHLAALSAHHRLLFAGLWLIADRAGRIEDRPVKIRAELFPYESSLDIDAMLTDLSGPCESLRRYTVDGQRYIQICKFLRHQNPHPKEAPSQIPKETEESLAKTQSREITRKATDEPCNFIDEPGGSGSGYGNGSGNGNGSTPPLAALAPAVSTTTTKAAKIELLPVGFPEFWAAYPKRKNKPDAIRSWKKQNPPLAEVIAALSWQVNQPQWCKEGGQFIPGPERYLNQRSWEEEPFHVPNEAGDVWAEVERIRAARRDS